MPSAQTPRVSGRRGGRARTPAKSLAARQNILLRWHPADVEGVIPPEALIDGAWYAGQGRAAAIARRTVRLKQEKHVAVPGGTFAPKKIVTAAA